MTACPIRYQRQVSDRKGKIFYTSITSLSHISKQCRIVFIYGEVDAEYKYFSDFLVRQGIYNILTGAVDEDRLEDAIERTYTAEDVVGYQAGPEEDREPIPKPISEVRPVVEPEQEKELEILLVEKIVERETIQTKVLGNVVIGVAALYPHGGSTHTALELAACLHRLKKDVGVLTDREVFRRAKDYYLLKESNGCIVLEGISIYTDEAQALGCHRVVIRDLGRLNGHNTEQFLKASCKLLVCGVSAWEIDTLTDYLRDNKYADTIEYLLWPANEAQAKSYIKNLRQGKCRGYAVAYNPDPLIKNTENTKMFQKLLQPLMDTI